MTDDQNGDRVRKRDIAAKYMYVAPRNRCTACCQVSIPQRLPPRKERAS